MQHPPLIFLVKLFPTCLSWASYDHLSWTKGQLGSMDGRTDHCDTLSHIFWPYPFNTVLKLPVLFISCFSQLSLFILTNLSLFFCKFLGAEAVLSFCYLALKHTGLWDQPVTLYIDSRPRERIGKRTLKKTEKDGGKGELSHNLHSHGCFKGPSRKETFQPQNRWVLMNFLYWKEGRADGESQNAL